MSLARRLGSVVLLGSFLGGAVAEAAPPFPLGGVAAVAKQQSSSALGRRKLAPGVTITAGKPVRVAFFDADSTLRVSKSGQLIATDAADVKLLPRVAGRIKQLNEAGFLVAIVSNQGGVGTQSTIEDTDGGLAQIAALLARHDARIDYYDFADRYDRDRKPDIGMAERLARLLRSKFGAGIDLAGSMMVGDAGYKRAEYGVPADMRPDGRPGTDFSNTDRGFADGLGVRFEHAPDYFAKKAL